MVSGSADKSIRIWQVESGYQLFVLLGHTGIVKSVSFSPDGKKIVSGSGDCSVRIWSVESRKELNIFEGHTDLVSSVKFNDT